MAWVLIPSFCTPDRTLSNEGGFNPRGNGVNGFFKTSLMAASTLPFGYHHAQTNTMLYHIMAGKKKTKQNLR
jgi:hypothetical protein